jgi:predicted ester cyclase
MTESERKYRRYIGYLNDRRVHDLGDFVCEQLAYNGQAMTRAQYQDMIAADIAAIPDLYFDVRLLVVEGDMIACRIEFNCTPQAEFLGLQPNGKRIAFAEHVFYRLREGKICEVWSLIDRDAVAKQLAS